jgi:oxalate decarboxylase
MPLLSYECLIRARPCAVPHSIQAFDEGLEILLLFSDGDFDASGTTFHASDWLVHTPLEILGQNFQLDPSVFGKLPAKFPYIFYPTVPPPQYGQGPKAPNDVSAFSPPAPPRLQWAGTDAHSLLQAEGSINNYIFSIRNQTKAMAPGGGGYTKLQTAATNFAPSTLFASQFVSIEPNGLRELHWNNNDGARLSCAASV